MNEEFKDNGLKSMELTDDALEGVAGGNSHQAFTCINCGVEVTGDAGLRLEYWLRCKCGKRYHVDRMHWKVKPTGSPPLDNVRWWN